MSGEPKVVFAREEALGAVTLQGPPLNLLDEAVRLLDTEDARGGITAFMQSGVADAAFAGR